MSEPQRLRAFVNGSGIEVDRGATVLDAVRAADPALGDEIAAGTRAIADNRGLVIDNTTPVTGGTVLRVVSARARGQQDASRSDGAGA